MDPTNSSIFVSFLQKSRYKRVLQRRRCGSVVERTLGKGKVESSILSSGTIVFFSIKLLNDITGGNTKTNSCNYTTQSAEYFKSSIIYLAVICRFYVLSEL